MEPVEHTDGIKKWSDESKTWVDATVADLGNVGNNGIGNWHLHPGCYVMDGSPSVWFYDMGAHANA